MKITLKMALRRCDAAERLVEVTLKREHPVGSTVSWERNGYHVGEVALHGYSDSIRVRNRRTGKEYWIRAAEIRG